MGMEDNYFVLDSEHLDKVVWLADGKKFNDGEQMPLMKIVDNGVPEIKPLEEALLSPNKRG